MNTLVAVVVGSYKVLSPVRYLIGFVLPRRTMAKAKVDFNSKHLKRGDPLPPFNGKLRIYNMRICPFAQRTMLALIAKNIDYELVNIHLAEKPEWLPRKSIFSKVPSIEIKEDVCIVESLITVEYLDEVYPQRPLQSKDPVRKALDKVIVEAAAPILTYFLKIIKAPETITDGTISAYQDSLKFLQNQLKDRDTPFFGGNEPGYVDYMIWPFFERLLILKKIYPDTNIDPEKFKLLRAYLDKMLEDPVVIQYLIPEKVVIEFLEAFRNGTTPNYDLLDNLE